MRPNLVIIDDHIPAATAAGSVEPMRKADHKAKAHSRPKTSRPSRHTSCGGRFAVRVAKREMGV